jgi:hypothetical protein
MADKFVRLEDFEAYKKMMNEKLEKSSKQKKVRDPTREIIPRQPNEYQMFMKNNLPKIRAETPGISPTDAIRKVAELWNLNKDKLKDSKPTTKTV